MDVYYLVTSGMLSILILFIIWNRRSRSKNYHLCQFPGLPPGLFFNNMLWAINVYARKSEHNPSVYILERMFAHTVIYRDVGMYTFWMANTGVVNCFKPEIMEAILGNSVSLDKSHEYRFLHPWLGQGLLTSTGSKWRNRRKLLTPAFHFRILEHHLPIFCEQAMVLVRKLHKMVDQECVDITPLVTLCTLDIVCESVMGVSIGAQSNSDSAYVKAIHDLGDYFNRRTVKPWEWSDFVFSLTAGGKKFAQDVKLLHSVTEKVIKEKKEAMLAKTTEREEEDPMIDSIGYYGKRKKAFMDLLLDLHVSGERLSEEDIREEVDTFMFEGHDTTAMGIIYALYCIGLYPDIQQKIMEEIYDIFGDNKERCVSYEEAKEMKYLECVLKESQRLYPSVPLIGRRMSEDLTINGLTIPKDTTVHCFIFAMHRIPECFPDPEKFDPDRFLPENSMDRHPYAYIPFSAGPRNCIGQKFALLEEKAVICTILRNFQIISVDPRDRIHVKVEFTLRPDQAMRIKFIPR